MANMASVSYAIEGPKEVLEEIFKAIVEAINLNNCKWEEYSVAKYLKLPINDDTKLGGEIYDAPILKDGVLRFYAEERWGLQDFAELLEKHFPDIKVYWVIEEPGMEIYCTNDNEGKYFPARYWVDTAIDGIYNSKYFKTEEEAYKWLEKLTYGRVKSEEDVKKFNADYEDSDASYENFIYIHEFEVVDKY